MTASNLAHLKEWIGRSEVTEDVIDGRRVAQMAGTLGLPRAPSAGDCLPLPWHWLLFPPVPQREKTGRDGHPARGEFLPPVPLPRRMWAGSDVACHRPLRVGEEVRRESTVASVEAKRGRGGELVFVTVEHAIYSESNEPAVEETQHIVYREPPPRAAPAKPDGVDREMPDVSHQWQATVIPDPVLLFRYSALTFNGHRIHYDRDYAVQEEGYAGLVVQGPLIASLLFRLACDKLGAMAISDFSFRARRPLFDGDPLLLRGAREGEQLTLWALTPEHQLAMRVDARLRHGAPGNIGL